MSGATLVALVAENLMHAGEEDDDDGAAWRVLDLAEGSGVVCRPTDDGDSFSFPAVLAVAALIAASKYRNA